MFLQCDDFSRAIPLTRCLAPRIFQYRMKMVLSLLNPFYSTSLPFCHHELCRNSTSNIAHASRNLNPRLLSLAWSRKPVQIYSLCHSIRINAKSYSPSISISFDDPPLFHCKRSFTNSCLSSTLLIDDSVKRLRRCHIHGTYTHRNTRFTITCFYNPIDCFFPCSAINSMDLFGILITVAMILILPTLIFVLVIFSGILFQPRWIVNATQNVFPNVLFSHNCKEKLIALTIDDSPNGESTNDILDVLRVHDCTATFFVIGEKIEKYKSIIHRMHKDGHEIGNHTMKDFPSWRLSQARSEFEKSLLEVDEQISSFFLRNETGLETKWFRPGHGWLNSKITRVIKKHNYRIALGSIFPMDCLFCDSAVPIANYCLWKSYPGAILILHDRPQQAQQTVEVLSIMLPRLKQRGYKVVTLSTLVKSIQVESNLNLLSASQAKSN